jgi:hypothetical protein
MMRKFKRAKEVIHIEYLFHKRMIRNIRKNSLQSNKQVLKYILERVILRRCSRCKSKGHLEHQSCAYTDEISNYFFLCDECHKETGVFYQVMWEDYWNGRL